jgi:hypothetical protein
MEAGMPEFVPCELSQKEIEKVLASEEFRAWLPESPRLKARAGGEDEAAKKQVLADWENLPKWPSEPEAQKAWDAERQRIRYRAKKFGVTLPKKK